MHTKTATNHTARFAACCAAVAGLLLSGNVLARVECYYQGVPNNIPQRVVSSMHPDQLPLYQVLNEVDLVVEEDFKVSCLHDEGHTPIPYAMALRHGNYTGQTSKGNGYYSYQTNAIAQRATIQRPGMPEHIVLFRNEIIIDFPGFMAQPGLGSGAQPNEWTTILPAGTRFRYEVAKAVDTPVTGTSQASTALTMVAGAALQGPPRFGPGNVKLNFANKPTCAVAVSNLFVDIPRMAPEALDSVGETPPGTTDITVNCQGGDGSADSDVNVFMHLTDANQRTSTSNILALTPGSSAKGVAIQVRRTDGTAVAMDPSGTKKWWAADVNAGVSKIPLNFVGVKTGSEPVGGGTYGGKVEFTLTYY